MRPFPGTRPAQPAAIRPGAPILRPESAAQPGNGRNLCPLLKVGRCRSMTNAEDREWVGATLRMAHDRELTDPQQSIALTLQIIALHLDRIADALEAGR